MKMMTYTQILWVNIGGKQQVAYNGAVEAVYTITSKSHMYLCAERSLGADISTHDTHWSLRSRNSHDPTKEDRLFPICSHQNLFT